MFCTLSKDPQVVEDRLQELYEPIQFGVAATKSSSLKFEAYPTSAHSAQVCSKLKK